LNDKSLFYGQCEAIFAEISSVIPGGLVLRCELQAGHECEHSCSLDWTDEQQSLIAQEGTA
jgi:hypothetical protein